MKFSFIVYFACFIVSYLPAQLIAEEKPVSHVIIVWLKNPDDPQMRHEFIEASKLLNDLPGIINRHVGEIMPTGRKIADESFDVAVTVTLKNREAFEAYMNHPKHKKLIETRMKPLVKHIIAYDFISQ